MPIPISTPQSKTTAAQPRLRAADQKSARLEGELVFDGTAGLVCSTGCAISKGRFAFGAFGEAACAPLEFAAETPDPLPLPFPLVTAVFCNFVRRSTWPTK